MLASLGALVYLAATANAYWLMGADFVTTQRMDAVVQPGQVSKHTHSFVGASNIGLNVTSQSLRDSECTTIPIKEDMSAYWAPTLYFQHSDGTFTSLGGGAVIYYLFPDTAGSVTAFPEDFRMVAGNPALRTGSDTKEQKAVSFKCLNFKSGTTEHSELPRGLDCADGIRAQINFPSCWNGKDTDSDNHMSHMAYPSGGPDSGTCNDPEYPVTTPRIFMEVYWSGSMEAEKSSAKDPQQPYVFANGDPTGYGYHADYVNGWEQGALQKAVDGCHCDPYGSFDCCVDQGVFSKKESKCRVTNTIDEEVTGKLSKLPGNNPVTTADSAAQKITGEESLPAILAPVYVYYWPEEPTQVGTPVSGGESAPADTPAESPAETPAESATTTAASEDATATSINNGSADEEEDDDLESCDTGAKRRSLRSHHRRGRFSHHKSRLE